MNDNDVINEYMALFPDSLSYYWLMTMDLSQKVITEMQRAIDGERGELDSKEISPGLPDDVTL